LKMAAECVRGQSGILHQMQLQNTDMSCIIILC
jgi:hypothetical protein